ncbi:neurogenic locus notch homolog protein 2 [Microplitis demolitor]|uniref:neurogenic locus notch homolog protein 2 n=1 Tax=Microplitis demolitor TaxID=69319 RepID=UPI00235B641E|nr:neurogenic locus notch homolog protein 2 [Microplitis demolitor]
MLTLNKWIFALIICFTIVKNSSGLSSNSSLRGHGDKCSTDSECASINGRCSDKQRCVCKPLYDFLFGKCTAVLGAHCEKPADCNIENVSCLDNKCFCPKNMHLAVNKTSCIKNATAPLDYCEKDDDCKAINHTSCLDNKCKCKDQYFASKEQCVAKLGAPCNDPIDCNIDSVSCSEKKCSCPENMHLARNETSCIKNATALGDFCEQTGDCQKIKQSICSNSKCECVNNYFEQNKLCVKGIGADCTQDFECKVIGSECTEKKCHCLENMHLANNRSRCVRNAIAVFDYCEKNDDCKAINHTSCLDNKCKCKDQYFASNEQCVAKLGTPCNKPTDCNIENVSCSGNRCSCPENMHLAVNKTSCIKKATVPFDFCEQAEDCIFVMHSDCLDNRCKCKNYYSPTNRKCIAELGAPCNKPTDCNIENVDCSGNKCLCPENMHLARNESSCIKNALAPLDFCEKNEDCDFVKHSKCVKEKCLCNFFYFPRKGKCVTKLEAILAGIWDIVKGY